MEKDINLLKIILAERSELINGWLKKQRGQSLKEENQLTSRQCAKENTME